MQQLTPEGQQTVDGIARRYGFSTDAVLTMLQAVMNGNGSMAQFSHPEFGGSGQWMSGGMTMIGDMFNSGLKNSVANLAQELANLVAGQPGLLHSGSFQSQSQGGQSQGGQAQYQGGQYQGGQVSSAGDASLFVLGSGGGNQWWPADLGVPNATGSQNNVRYAYFASARRLVIDLNGQVTVYDTLDHQIGGVSQQQSVGGSITFTSQYGTVSVTDLPVISVNGNPHAAPAPVHPQGHGPSQAPGTGARQVSPREADIFNAIERLADLRGRGILSDEEFAAKKAELLGRL
jgi:hypothetical protein